jgi:dihydrolipoamide dehydrogenase
MDIQVPDIGDFKEVEVIEILVKVGDVITADQSLITVESDKASMEIPSSHGGKVTALKVKVGDKVAKGSVVLQVQEEVAAASGAVPTSAANSQVSASTPAVTASTNSAQSPASTTSTAPQAVAPVSAQAAAPGATTTASYTGAVDHQCELLVIGAGPGGYSAAFRAADLGLNTIIVERYSTLGGVCLNVGCIPSKALLHVAAVMDEAKAISAHGISFGAPTIDLDKLRGWRNQVVGKLTGGLVGMAKARKVSVVRGNGTFIDAHHLRVQITEGDGKGESGKSQVIRFEKAIIAAGSQAVHLPFVPKDPRIVDSTGALQLPSIPKRMLVMGGGIIGLEMGTVYSTLGTRLDVVEMLDGLMQGADRDVVKVWQKFNEKRFDNIMLKTRAVKLEATKAGIKVWFEGEKAPAEPQVYDMVLQSVGRKPNGLAIGAQAAGVKVDERGFIAVDKQQRTNVAHIFAIGDLVGQPMLAHKAVHEGHVAAEVAAGKKSYLDARVIPSVAYTDPEVAWVGLTEEEATTQGIKVTKAVFPWAASGRAIANGRDEGFTKLLFDPETHRIVGGAIVGTHAGDLISEVCLAIEMGADAVDIGKTIHPHPTLGESIGMAAEVFEGSCTDLPPIKKRA